jgi:predicted transcriptional regulator/DNA-binding XRE family transcriptional regulator
MNCSLVDVKKQGFLCPLLYCLEYWVLNLALHGFSDRINPIFLFSRTSVILLRMRALIMSTLEEQFDPLIVGRKIRELRTKQGMNLEVLARAIERAPSQVSAIENGKRTPPILQLQKIANALGVTLNQLLTADKLSERSANELEIERAQRSGLYASLGLPDAYIGKTVSNNILDIILGLQREVERLHLQRAATPEEARRANLELRKEMRKINNYFPALEEEARNLLAKIDHTAGPLSERLTAELANNLGFTLHYTQELPASTRVITDEKNGRIYLPMRREGRDARTILLQALAGHVLKHSSPIDYGDYLSQRVLTNYLAGALLMPESIAVDFLQSAKTKRELSVEDLRDHFGVSYETAAHRFTNLATVHLELPVHFLKVHESGAISKAYENDNVTFPSDVFGSVEGQIVCRNWSARKVFTVEDRFTPYYQYTDKPAGTYWCTSRIENSDQGQFSISVGTKFETVKYFRGRASTTRYKSNCPEPTCCRHAPAELEDKWGGMIRPTPRLNSSLLAAMPQNGFLGIEHREVLEFLEGLQDS